MDLCMAWYSWILLFFGVLIGMRIIRRAIHGPSLTRATPLYAEPDSFGSLPEHAGLSYAAMFNVHRELFCPDIRGGYFDRLQLLDREDGRFSSDEKELRSYLEKNRELADKQAVIDHVQASLANPSRNELAQVILGSGITQISPEDRAQLDEDYAKGLQNCLDEVSAYTPPPDLITFRLVQLIHVIRAAHTVGWLEEDEALAFVIQVQANLDVRVCRYRTWQEFGAMMLRCSEVNLYEDHQRALQRGYDWLIQDPESPWQKIPLHRLEDQKDFARIVPPYRPRLPVAWSPEPPAELVFIDSDLMALADALADDPEAELFRFLEGDPRLRALPQDRVDALLEANPDHPGVIVLVAERALEIGFEARGSGWANQVSQEGWRILHETSTLAIELVARGLKLAPHNPALVMIALSATQHGDGAAAVELRDRAMWLANGAMIGNIDVQRMIQHYNVEKWGAGPRDAFDLAEDRLARSGTPAAAVLYMMAAVEYVMFDDSTESDRRSNDPELRRRVLEVARDNLPLVSGRWHRTLRMWMAYWASQVNEPEMLLLLGPEPLYDYHSIVPWAYEAPLYAKAMLGWMADAALPGHPEWGKRDRLPSMLSRRIAAADEPPKPA